MQPIFAYLSGLAATIILLHRLWSYAPLGRTFTTAAIIGLGVYMVLLGGYAFVRYIATRPEPEEETATEGEEEAPQAEG